MSRKSAKLNIIDERTYENLTKNNIDSSSRILRNAKYKNKHKKTESCTLFDFLVMPRKQPKKKRNPNFKIARNSVNIQVKRKGKTRLLPKERVTRLKRIIRSYRRRKKQVHEDQQSNVDVFETVNVKSANEGTGQCVDSTTSIVTIGMKNLTLAETEIEKPTTTVHKIHSRRFRSYCDNCTTVRLKELTTQLLNDLVRFQTRAYANNEIKARAHPRLVVGFREALSRLRINKVKLLLLAPDCEMCADKGGLDDTIEELKSVCQQQNAPYCFSLMRRELAYALHKRAQISCVAILDYDGANETYKLLIQELNEARIQFKDLIAR